MVTSGKKSFFQPSYLSLSYWRKKKRSTVQKKEEMITRWERARAREMSARRSCVRQRSLFVPACVRACVSASLCVRIRRRRCRRHRRRRRRRTRTRRTSSCSRTSSESLSISRSRALEGVEALVGARHRAVSGDGDASDECFDCADWIIRVRRESGRGTTTKKEKRFFEKKKFLVQIEKINHPSVNKGKWNPWPWLKCWIR